MQRMVGQGVQTFYLVTEKSRQFLILKLLLLITRMDITILVGKPDLIRVSRVIPMIPRLSAIEELLCLLEN